MKRGADHDRIELGSKRAGMERKVGRPEDFARNLQILTRSKRLSAAQAARAITAWWHDFARKGFQRTRRTAADQEKLEFVLGQHISERWYRRVMREGVSRGDKRTFRWIEAMAAYFGVQYEDFWSPDLTAVSIRTEQSGPTELDEVVQQFRQLVEDGEEWLAEAVRAAWRARPKG